MTSWQKIEKLVPVFQKTFQNMLDFEKFSLIAMTFHSTAIEGSTLTLTESEMLLDKGLTPKGKPLIHQQMVLDHHDALLKTLKLAEEKTLITVPLIQQVASFVMKNTGSKYNTPLGEYDVAKGDLRLHNVRAGEQYFVNYDKVRSLLDELVEKVQVQIKNATLTQDVLKLSFDFHFKLVTIHPFGDGNGRTSRLMMNFVQHYHDLPIAPVFQKDRAEYIQSLMESRKQNSMEPFYEFMSSQYLEYLTSELERFESQQ